MQILLFEADNSMYIDYSTKHIHVHTLHVHIKKERRTITFPRIFQKIIYASHHVQQLQLQDGTKNTKLPSQLKNLHVKLW